MCPALSSLNSPRPSISAPLVPVLPQRTSSGQIRRFISPFPPPRLLPPALSPARRPPSWPRSCARTPRGKCASLVWNSSDRSSKSRPFVLDPPIIGAILLHSPVITASSAFLYTRLLLL